jgi:signal transduction histidine kinase
MQTKGNRRSKLGWLIDPQHQLRFAFYLIGGGVTALMLISLYILISLEKNIQAILEKGQVPSDVSDALLDHVGRAELNVTGISLFLMAVSVFVGVRLSHRIYGPIVQFRRHVANLIRGDYTSRVNLRDHDQFFELSEDLNALAEQLQKARQA